MKTKRLPGIIMLYCLLCAIRIDAQQVNLNNKVNLPTANLRIDSLIHVLNRESGIQFSFNSHKIIPSKRINVVAGVKTLREVLNKLKESFGIEYKIVGHHVILVDGTKMAQPTGRSPVTVGTGKATKPLTGPKIVAVHPASLTDSAHLKNSITTSEVSRINKSASNEQLPLAPSNNKPDSIAATKTIDTSIQRLEKIIPSPKQVAVVKIDSPGKNKPARTGSSWLNNLDLELGPRGIGLNRSFSTGRSSTMELAMGIGAAYFVSGKYFYYTFQLLHPAFYFSVRNKFFFAPSFYLGIQAKYHSTPFFQPGTRAIDTAIKWVSGKGFAFHAVMLDTHIGYEKQLSKRLKLDMHAGIGYAFGTQGWSWNHWYPAVGVRLLYQLKR